MGPLFNALVEDHDDNVEGVEDEHTQTLIPVNLFIDQDTNQDQHCQAVENAIPCYWIPRKQQQQLDDNNTVVYHLLYQSSGIFLPLNMPQTAMTPKMLKTADPTMVPMPRSLLVMKVPMTLAKNSGELVPVVGS